MRSSAAILAVSFFCASALAAAAPVANVAEAEFYNTERATLQQLLDMNTSVASRSMLRLRETPGIVTLITAEEIQQSGARDLVDVLSQVPEFTFGVDVQGNLGLGVRGHWGNEGKVLLLWDGFPYNEPLYATLQFDRFPVDQIEEIEIIRGPGSALYGGNAELAVINVRTRTPAALDGGRLYAAYGQGALARARSYAGFSWGKAEREAEYSAQAFWGEGQRSDRRYADFAGSSYNMNRASDLRPRMANVYARRGGSSLRLIADGYELRDRDHFSDLLSTGSSKVEFPGLFAEFRHDLRPAEGLALRPYLSYSLRSPWREKDDYFAYDKRVSRLSAGLLAQYAPSPGAELTAGGEFSREAVSVDLMTAPDSRYADGGGRTYENTALFGQASLGLAGNRVTAGARWEKHSHYGSALVPRLALTRVAGDFNLKGIYSMAFKAPTIENIRLNPRIKPETSYTAEGEVGYKASETLYASVNFFHSLIVDPIVFTYAGGKETYDNFSRTATAGGGAAVRCKSGRLRADLGYIYQEAVTDGVGLYRAGGKGSYTLAFPRHKLTLSASVPLSERLSLNPSAFYVSKRYGYGGDGSLRVFREAALANLNLLAKDALARGLTLSLGVRDLFGSGYRYLQPYDGGHAPLPAPSREIFAKAVYEF